MSVVGKFIPRQQPSDIEVNDFIAQLQAGGVAVSQDAFQAQALGLTAWNMRVDNASTSQALTTDTVYAIGIWLPGGVTINNLVFRVNTRGAGTSPTGMYVGLVDPHGDVLAVSNNLASSNVFTSSVGLVEAPLSAPITLSDAEVGWYYGLLLQVGVYGTTQPSLSRSLDWGGVGTNGAVAYGYTATGQTLLPAVGSQVTILSGPHNFFMGVN